MGQGDVPADSEMQSPPRLVPFIVRPNLTAVYCYCSPLGSKSVLQKPALATSLSPRPSSRHVFDFKENKWPWVASSAYCSSSSIKHRALNAGSSPLWYAPSFSKVLVTVSLVVIRSSGIRIPYLSLI